MMELADAARMELVDVLLVFVVDVDDDVVLRLVVLVETLLVERLWVDEVVEDFLPVEVLGVLGPQNDWQISWTRSCYLQWS